MSKINDLIKEMCPNGVEFKSLKEVFDIFSGMTGVTNKWAEEGNCQFIDYMNAYKNNKIDITNLPYATVKNINQIILVQGDLLLTSASEVPDECAIASVIEDKIQDGVFMDDHLFGLRLKDEYKNIINTTFISYYLNSKPFRCNLFKAVRGVTRFYISNKDYMKLNIPIPPIKVQEEIVRILDKFGELEVELEVELEAELEARKSQYEFWHRKLFENNSKIIRLGGLCSIKTGFKPKDILELGDYEYVNAGTTNSGYTTVANAKGDCVTTPSRGQGGIGFVGFQENDFWCGPLCYQIRTLTDKLTNKYLYYYMLAHSDYILGLKHEGGVPAVNIKELQEMPICIPTLEEQERVVNILDKFDKLINDISEGLPAEIELRRKQYEYYRNKLLSFEVCNDG